MFFTPGAHKDHGLAHNPFSAIVAPRPIGWISSIGRDGGVNLAPYSFFNALSYTPPVVGFSSGPALAGGGPKDTISNVMETECFVANIVSAAQFEAMNATSATLPRGESEFPHAGLEAVDSEIITAPRVRGAPCHLECKLFKIVDLPAGPDGTCYRWVMGEVVGIHIDERYIRHGKLDVTLYRPVSRLGGNDYAIIEKLVELERPK